MRRFVELGQSCKGCGGERRDRFGRESGWVFQGAWKEGSLEGGWLGQKDS